MSRYVFITFFILFFVTGTAGIITMTQMDRNFDELAEKFERKIYGGFKGRIRLNILSEDLFSNIPALSTCSGLNILDAGGGTGQLSVQLAQAGHRVVLNDISANMLQLAKSLFQQHHIADEYCQFIHASVQRLNEQVSEQFDLVLFHAVLEWLAEPENTLTELNRFIKPGGYLSLMFYNKNSIIYRNLLHGNFRKIATNDFSGQGRSLTPLNPLEPEVVYQWVRQNQLEVVAKSGIRVFSDNMRPEVKTTRNEEDLMKMETSFCRQEPYISLGRYIHLLCRKYD